jgi:hypothetical protein
MPVSRFGPEWRRFALLGTLFWSLASLVGFLGRTLWPDLLLLWILGIAILWAGAVALAALRARRLPPAAFTWELEAVVTGMPSALLESVVLFLGRKGALEVESSPARGTLTARLPGRPPLGFRLVALTEGGRLRLLVESEAKGPDPEERAPALLHRLVAELDQDGFECRVEESRSRIKRKVAAAWLPLVLSSLLGILAGLALRLLI